MTAGARIKKTKVGDHDAKLSLQCCILDPNRLSSKLRTQGRFESGQSLGFLNLPMWEGRYTQLPGCNNQVSHREEQPRVDYCLGRLPLLQALHHMSVTLKNRTNLLYVILLTAGVCTE